MTSKRRIFLADDHALVLTEIRNLIAAEADFEIAGDAMTGPDALQKLRGLKPDLAIIDISLPGIDGILLTRSIAEEMPDVRVVVLTLHEDRAYVTQALDAGAQGYVVNRSAGECLVPAVRLVLAGGTYVDPAVAFRPLVPTSIICTDVVSAIEILSELEVSVLKLSSQGFTNREIEYRTEIGIKAIETVRASGYRKLGLRTRADLVRYAAQAGWFSDD
jgi:DNA-binding NarL/FixJ family response regulator